MGDWFQAFGAALGLIFSFDPALMEIVALSLRVSLTALGLASLVALPVGGAIGILRFRGRRALVILLNALMGLPPVVVGLMVYLLLSRSGPLGRIELLFTPSAMILAQSLLIFPIVAALTRQVCEDVWEEYAEQLRSLGVQPYRSVLTVLWEARFSLFTAVLAGFGRAIGEVGAAILVGGNIAHTTRVMTTAIVLETNRGELALAVGLGVLLLLLSLIVNGAAQLAQELAREARR